jgi:CRISPR/Cas system CSM-associated protein Csm2 small subunit
LNLDNITLFEYNYENIESELGSLLLPGLRRFKPEEIRFVTYKYEGFRGKKSSIITNFNEKYLQKELNKGQVKYIFDFIYKEDAIKKKNNNNKKNIKKILFSLQLLIDYIQRENYDKFESLYDIIKKLPNQINICDETKQFFKGLNKNESKNEEDEFNLLSNNDKGNKASNDNIYFSICTLISIFELFEHLCWDSFKENLVGDYLQKIDPAWGTKIKQYFVDIDKNQNKIIKKITLCTSLRRFISRYLTGKRGENEINENNTLLNEILRPELWKPFFTESDTFEIEIGEIMSVMTDQYDGSLKVGQALALYDLLGGDQTLIDKAKTNYIY